ncbi:MULTISPECIES: rolling circle replication-associated protein [unclassified Campylobacter]|uniref:rolling circle replication-associated protein n=1 Tax=unclassified Campylobacter TaxID=2593542 RepID=UPI0022E9C4E9|nr:MULTISPECIES: replication endonuclease [unclassified Campylobacter]MDA3056774.1 replication endonuclease [Campylobacter sp. CN_NA1]MDA3065937.1 replication endonuclease [Campylobacter sp. CN_NE4]MDA3069107.1 replication endonuclease [Campylobacter sp. CN_NE3]MDA3083263.1 replication endonuclease [Campylobacter sp. CN_EL2]MDA3084800.1 replication endonuclease [Campylobacter sp. CN_NE1]
MSYGLSEFDLDFVRAKIKKQRDFLENTKFINSFGEEKTLLSVSKSANFSGSYYAEIANRTNTIHSLTVKNALVPVFLTITLNGCFRKALVGNFSTFTTKDIKSLPIEQKAKLNSNECFNIRDLVNVLNYNFDKFNKRFRKIYPNEKMQYIRTFEPHKKDGVPHIHALIYVPKHTIPYLLQAYKDIFYASQNLRNDRLSNEQRKNGEINGFQITLKNATGYVMKYITKTFINYNETDEINEVQAWFIKHKIRRFLSSRTPIPLWVYRKINFIKGLQDFANLNILNDIDDTLIEWDYGDKSIFISIPYTSEELIYENGHLLYYVCGRLKHEYKKEISMNFKPKNSSFKFARDENGNYIKENSKFEPEMLSSWTQKPFSKMTNLELTDLYLNYDLEYMNPQKLGILENELFNRGLNCFTHKKEKHDLNDIHGLKNDFASRGIQPLDF